MSLITTRLRFTPRRGDVSHARTLQAAVLSYRMKTIWSSETIRPSALLVAFHRNENDDGDVLFNWRSKRCRLPYNIPCRKCHSLAPIPGSWWAGRLTTSCASCDNTSCKCSEENHHGYYKLDETTSLITFIFRQQITKPQKKTDKVSKTHSKNSDQAVTDVLAKMIKQNNLISVTD